jgi:hypothetical protein
VLLKTVLLVYSRGLMSSRKWARACRENVVYMAMSCGQQSDHSTTAAVVSSMAEQTKTVIRQFHTLSLIGRNIAKIFNKLAINMTYLFPVTFGICIYHNRSMQQPLHKINTGNLT